MAGCVVVANSRSLTFPSAPARSALPYDTRWVKMPSASTGTWKWFSQNSVMTSRT